MFEHRDLVRAACGREAVRDEDDGLRALAARPGGELLDGVEDLALRVRVERGGLPRDSEIQSVAQRVRDAM